jgi:hypothetical protein
MEEQDNVTLMPPEPDVDQLEESASILDVEVQRLQSLRMAAMEIHAATNWVRHVIEAVRRLPDRRHTAEQAERLATERLARLTAALEREDQRQTGQRDTLRTQAELARSDTERRQAQLEREWQELRTAGETERQEVESQIAAITSQHEARIAQIDAEYATKREALERELTATGAIIADATAHYSDR